jgi:hypothetical protein
VSFENVRFVENTFGDRVDSGEGSERGVGESRAVYEMELRTDEIRLGEWVVGVEERAIVGLKNQSLVTDASTVGEM